MVVTEQGSSEPGSQAVSAEPLRVLVDGAERPFVSASDRGLHYGDGLFETLSVVRGTPRHWERHLARLIAGCERLGLPSPEPALLWAEASGLCAGAQTGVLKLLYTRGVGGRGYRPEPGPALRILILYRPPFYPARFWEEGVALRVCRTALGTSPALAGLKHLNRLEQVLARAEWDDPAVPEGLMLDVQGHVVEGTQANVFIVKSGRLLTPELSQSGVCGVVRALVLEHAPRIGLETEMRRLTLQEVMEADEMFVCNSVVGIWPVHTLEHVRYRSSTVTRKLMSGLRSSGVL
jgi:4-amino-4-deoxychorismate lyase